MTAQLLAGPPAGDPLAVAERLLAIQAQDMRGAHLAVRARTSGVSLADIERALSEERSLLVTWLNRGTLHLVRSEDYWWLHQLTAPRLQTANARRLAQEGVTPDAAERGIAVIERALADGPLERDRLRELVASAGVRTQGQAFVHLLGLASLRGLIVRGPILGGTHAFVLVRDWLRTAARVDRDRAVAELARRYLAGHGPASDRDLARWSGLALRDARAGLQAIASELAQREGGLVDLKHRVPVAPLPEPRLLGPFEPLLLGWSSRERILGPNESRVVSGGIFRAFALARGRAVGTWKLPRQHVQLELFDRLSPAERDALETDANDVNRFLNNQ
ncbi:MAG TPA: winged helix DNA-binding domain-containing protein [Solirubrobacteraceae bacterium]|nr:winged helix DNA-binding domain-containing protein [Solirubrobacteraceae bacterium]